MPARGSGGARKGASGGVRAKARKAGTAVDERVMAAGAFDDPVHDPGVERVRERAESLGRVATRVLLPGSEILLGTASWTDPTMTAPGVFYPDDATTPEARLRHYASVFPMVEADSSYYAIPAREVTEKWVERTPDGFVFNLKAYALMTGHPSETKRLPKALREALPASLREAKRVYPKDLPAEIMDEVWRLFLDAVEPLRSAGKLGAILLQYPPWFVPTRESAAEIAKARERLGDLPAAVEFRRPTWVGERLRERTSALLERTAMSYVGVDEPQGTDHSVPPLQLVTSRDLAIVRMHGRRGDTWTKRGASVHDRFRYFYDEQQLAEWVPRVASVAESAKQVHVVFNNCYGNYGTTNAIELGAMIAEQFGH